MQTSYFPIMFLLSWFLKCFTDFDSFIGLDIEVQRMGPLRFQSIPPTYLFNVRHIKNIAVEKDTVSSYSTLFTVRCGALTHVPLKGELEYDNAPHRTANNAEYELTFN